MAKWLYSLDRSVDISFNDESPFCCASENGNIQVVKWLLEIKPDINITTDNNYAFSLACENDHISVVKWIHTKLKERNLKENKNMKLNDVNDLTNKMLGISSDGEFLFRYAVFNNRYRIVKYLLEIKPNIDITINNHELFEYACENDYGRIAFLLTKLNKNYKVEFEYDINYIENDDNTDSEYEFDADSNFYPTKNIVNWYNYDLFKCLGSKVYKEPINCCICFENGNVITKCNHHICLNCMVNLKKRKCPYCRQNLESYYLYKVEK